MLSSAIVLAVIAVSHWLGGVTAFGSSLLAFPVLVWFLDVEAARTILLVIGAAQAYQVFLYTYRRVNWRQLGRMIFFACLGLPVGVLAVSHLPKVPLFVFLGVVLIASGSSRMLSRERRRPWPATVLNGLLVLGGVLHGAFVSGGATLVIYAQHKVSAKESFRGTLSAFWATVNTVLLAVLLLGEHDIHARLPLLAAAIPLTLLVTWHGNRTARRLPQRRFEQLVAVLLIVAGVVTIGRVL